MEKVYKFWNVDEENIKILIHTDSFANSPDEEIVKLNWLVEYHILEFIEIEFIPTVNKKVISKDNLINLKIPEYTVLNNRIHIKIRDIENNPGPIIYNRYEEKKYVFKSSSFTNYDMHYFEYLEKYFLLLSQKEYENIKNSNDKRIVTLDKIFHYLNLFFLNKKAIYLNPYQRVSNFLYYLYKRTRNFKKFDLIFKISIYSGEKDLGVTLFR